MITKSFEIANGVSLKYIETDKFKTNYFSFNFVAELSRKKSCYYTMIPAILMRGCRKYPTQAELNKRLQYLYSGEIMARNSAFGEYQLFGIKANMLDDRFGENVKITRDTIELICNMIFDPYLVDGVFDKAYTKTEKLSLIDVVESEKNNKGAYSVSILKEEMCKDEVFSVSKYGTVEQIKRITAKSLYNAYAKAIKELPIEIYFVGKCDIESIANLLKGYFNKIERSVISIKEAPTVENVEAVKEVTDTENVKQGKLCLGFRTGYKVSENKYYRIQLFNEIFGGSPTSKLFMNVREKMSLCYTCRSIVSQRNGIMIVSSGIEFENKEIATKAIVDQLNAIKQGEISKEEFESAKKSLINGYKQIYDCQESMESWAFYRGLCKTLSTPNDECIKVEAASIDDIKQVAAKITLDTIYFLQGKSVEDKND